MVEVAEVAEVVEVSEASELVVMRVIRFKNNNKLKRKKPLEKSAKLRRKPKKK